MSEDEEIIKDLADQLAKYQEKVRICMGTLEWIANFSNNKDMKRMAEKSIADINNV